MSGEAGGGGTPRPVGAQAQPNDPAMEDILASIRRILNEDDPPPAGATPAAPATQPSTEAQEPEVEPLTLTEDMLVSVPPEAPATEAAPVTEVPPSSPQGAAAPVAPVEPPPAASDAAGLLGPAAAAAAMTAVSQLVRAVAQERNLTVSRGGPSIEDVVREELRPLLKEWLDTHLPPLVERLVRAEIERVVSRSLG